MKKAQAGGAPVYILQSNALKSPDSLLTIIYNIWVFFLHMLLLFIKKSSQSFNGNVLFFSFPNHFLHSEITFQKFLQKRLLAKNAFLLLRAI